MNNLNTKSPADPLREAFDSEFYLSEYPDIASSGIDPFSHFMEQGWREGRDPSPRFSVEAYLEANGDVREAGVNPFQHYILTGRIEGRAVKLVRDFRSAALSTKRPLEARLQEIKNHIGPVRPQSPSVLAKLVAGHHKDVSEGHRLGLHLTVSHDDFARHIGGVQQCISRESEALQARGMDHIHLCPAIPSLVVDIETKDPFIQVVWNGKNVGVFTAETIGEEFSALSSQRKTFSVHSFIGHNIPAITSILKRMEFTEGFYWTHDYSSVCASFALLRNGIAFCGAPAPDSAACTVCEYGLRRRVQLSEHVKFFRAFSLTVVSPSDATRELWASRFPVKPHAMVTLPHARFRPTNRPPVTVEPAGRLKIAFVGIAADYKGWPVFQDLVERFEDDGRFEFLHFSNAPAPRSLVRHVPVEAVRTGDNAMIAALEREAVDIAVIWSLCPETFCFTAHEAIAAGVYIVANPDSGNVPRLIEATGCGVVLPDEDALMELFNSHDVDYLSRASRKSLSYDLEYGQLTAELIAGEQQ